MAERESTGAAKRRRERRLRMHWRHEQLTLRMVLATVEHHSHVAPRGQTTATRTRAEERETYSAPRRQEPPLPAVTSGTQYYVGRRERACDGRGTTGAGSEARHGAVWRTRSHGADPRCSCAADGGQVGGCAEDRRPLCRRAGYRSAQDLKQFPSSSSSGSSCAADGGTVGGSAIAGVVAAGARLRCRWQGVDLRVEAVHGGLLGGHQVHPDDPPDRVYHQPRVENKYWARLRRLLWSSL